MKDTYIDDKLLKSLGLAAPAVLIYLIYRAIDNIFFIADGVTQPRFYLYLLMLYIIALPLIYTALSLINQIHQLFTKKTLDWEALTIIGTGFLTAGLYITHIVVFIPVILERQGIAAISTMGRYPLLFITGFLALGTAAIIAAQRKTN